MMGPDYYSPPYHNKKAKHHSYLTQPNRSSTSNKKKNRILSCIILLPTLGCAPEHRFPYHYVMVSVLTKTSTADVFMLLS